MLFKKSIHPISFCNIFKLIMADTQQGFPFTGSIEIFNMLIHIFNQREKLHLRLFRWNIWSGFCFHFVYSFANFMVREKNAVDIDDIDKLIHSWLAGTEKASPLKDATFTYSLNFYGLFCFKAKPIWWHKLASLIKGPGRLIPIIPYLC